MIQVPQRGPGCQHFLTCAMCLMAPKFTGCGWCSGVCSWENECDDHWRNESCPPGISGVSFLSRMQILWNPKYVISCWYVSADTVLPTDCSPWRSDRADGVWVGVSVPLETCHHFQNPPSETGTNRLHRASSQKQQHPVSGRTAPALVHAITISVDSRQACCCSLRSDFRVVVLKMRPHSFVQFQRFLFHYSSD